MGIATYAGRRYIYDAASPAEPVVHIPTQPISEPIYQLLSDVALLLIDRLARQAR